MRSLLPVLVLSLILVVRAASAQVADSPTTADSVKPNVLFIAIDDLNHWVGYTGRNLQAKTPNIDRLSRMGVSFTHAYCAAPACNPTRAALMSGLRPSTSGCYVNGDDWKLFIPEGLGLTATFRKAGYYATGAGKVYHGNSGYPSDWDEYFGLRLQKEGDRVKDIGQFEGFHDPLVHDLKDEDLSDWHITSYCVEQLGKQHDRPFFLACGMHKPHLPWVVPRKYYDMFPLESIQLPPYKEDDLDDVPPAGIRMALPAGDHKRILESGRWKAAIQSYLAASAYADMNVGRLLDALGKSRYRDNTIIILWGDHGWHFGEKSHWRKFALWEEATRAPLIWVVPGVTKPGGICGRTVDFMSIYPTLCELTGIPCPEHVEGTSIKPLLADPDAEWTTPAVCTYRYQNHSIRNEQFRYIRYADGSEEFYAESEDPYEWSNLANRAELAAQKAELAKWLPANNTPPRKPYTGRRAPAKPE